MYIYIMTLLTNLFTCNCTNTQDEEEIIQKWENIRSEIKANSDRINRLQSHTDMNIERLQDKFMLKIELLDNKIDTVLMILNNKQT
jgi:hypothetical protein